MRRMTAPDASLTSKPGPPTIARAGALSPFSGAGPDNDTTHASP